jgi:hypothetical protein
VTWITGAKPTQGIETKVHFRNCRSRSCRKLIRALLTSALPFTNNQYCQLRGKSHSGLVVTSESINYLETGALVLLEIMTLDFEDLPVIAGNSP